MSAFGKELDSRTTERLMDNASTIKIIYHVSHLCHLVCETLIDLHYTNKLGRSFGRRGILYHIF